MFKHKSLTVNQLVYSLSILFILSNNILNIF